MEEEQVEEEEAQEETPVKEEPPWPKPKKYRILVTNSNLPKEALDILSENCEVHFLPDVSLFGRFAQSMDGLLIDNPSIKLDREFFRSSGLGLKVVSIVGWSGDQIDLKEAAKRKVRIGICSSDLALDSAAEVAVGMALALCRRIKEGNNSLMRQTAKVGCPDWLLGQDLKNCVCGILGLGKLGASIAIRLLGFQVKKIVYYSRRIKKAGEKLGIERVLYDQLLEISDMIFLCLPCNQTTRGIINEENFIKMKRCSILINPSHGGLIRINELYCALRKGLIFGAGVDSEVMEAPPPKHPIHKLDNFIMLPSVGRNSALVKLRMNFMAVQNLVSGLFEKKVLNPLPDESVLSLVETEEKRVIREEKEERIREEAEKRFKEEEEKRFEEAEEKRIQEEEEHLQTEMVGLEEGEESKIKGEEEHIDADQEVDPT